MVDPKYSQNHIIFEKCKTVQSFKLNFHHNISLVQIYNSASNSKAAGNIPGRYSAKGFSALPSYF